MNYALILFITFLCIFIVGYTLSTNTNDRIVFYGLIVIFIILILYSGYVINEHLESRKTKRE